MNRKSNTQNNGFTLIELLVVIAIIGFLASVVFVNLNRSRIMTRNAIRKSDASQLKKAIELYYNDRGEYPRNGAVDNPNNETDACNLASFLVPQYITNIPTDPKNQPTPYQYVWKQNGRQYGLLVPFANDGGTNCKFMTEGGSANWFSSAPVCNY